MKNTQTSRGGHMSDVIDFAGERKKVLRKRHIKRVDLTFAKIGAMPPKMQDDYLKVLEAVFDGRDDEEKT